MVCISFDVEEFDMPLEYNGTISLEEQLSISRTGVETILNLLNRYDVKATFFITAVFAQNNEDVIKRMAEQGHEIASHTYYHSAFHERDLLHSKLVLEAISGRKVYGLRMPRMQDVNPEAVADAGYRYNSSVNPTWLPGRYNKLHIPRTLYKEGRLIQIPASVSPLLRFPLFWLSFHNLPFNVYRYLLKRAYDKDGYVNIYFHPWEFADISNQNFRLPSYTISNTGDKMTRRFARLLDWIRANNFPTGTLHELTHQKPGY